jgi:glycosyltransferase involved in cell wall biosynthesis
MISFVIPAYNESRSIAAAIAAIRGAMAEIGGDYEIVVADDASSDDTAAIAQAAGARVIPASHRQIASTRNTGARASGGDRLFFVDADTQVTQAVVRAALAALDTGVVGGGARPIFEDEAPGWAHPIMTAVIVSMRWFRLAAGCFVFCRRDAFEAVGGWDERHFAGEEIMLSLALRRHGRFVILRETVVTSSRKFHQRSLWQTLWLMASLSVKGLWGVRSREHTSFWYDGKR